MNYRYYQIILQVKHLYTNPKWCEVLTGYLSLGRRPGGNGTCRWHWTKRFTVFFETGSSSSPSDFHIFFLITLLDEAFFLRNIILIIIIIVIINIKDWTLWSVPSPELQLLAPTLLRSSNCSSSLWSVVVWFQRDSVLWHSLQVWKPVSSVFIYLVYYACNP